MAFLRAQRQPLLAKSPQLIEQVLRLHLIILGYFFLEDSIDLAELKVGERAPDILQFDEMLEGAVKALANHTCLIVEFETVLNHQEGVLLKTVDDAFKLVLL